MTPQTVTLIDRASLIVSGPGAEHFLQNLITTDLEGLSDAELRPGALLSPQGKILFDFLVSRSEPDAFRLDARADIVADLARRLALYRLRAKIDIAPASESVAVAAWHGASTTLTDGRSFRDTRFPAEWGVARRYLGAPAGTGDDAAWRQLRIAGGVAESGDDYALGDVFPHDVLLDQNGGVGFRKGCYVGQEVVSRMHHRGTARRRVMIASAERDLPPSGTEVVAAGRPIGALGTVVGPRALAILRTDRLADALTAQTLVLAGYVPAAFAIPPGANFTLSSPDPASVESA